MATETMVVPEVPVQLQELSDQPYEVLNGQLAGKKSLGRLQHSHLGKMVKRLIKSIVNA
jgi:hypothetical protein